MGENLRIADTFPAIWRVPKEHKIHRYLKPLPQHHTFSGIREYLVHKAHIDASTPSNTVDQLIASYNPGAFHNEVVKP